jgi:arginine deiminase
LKHALLGTSHQNAPRAAEASRQAITQVAAALFANGAADHVVVAGMPKLRAAMHLDTVFTFVDCDVVTLYPRIIGGVHTFSLRPSDRAPGVEVVDHVALASGGRGGEDQVSLRSRSRPSRITSNPKRNSRS